MRAMWGRVHRAILLVGVLVACQSENALTPSDPSLVKGSPTTTVNPNGPVWVLGSFTLQLTSSAGDAGINKHPQGKGSCAQADGTVSSNPADNTYWLAPGSSQVTGAPFCQASSEPVVQNLVCTIDANGLPGTYAFGTGGQGAPAVGQITNNENMNFHSDLIPQQLDQFVHYQVPSVSSKKAGNTTGKDMTAFTFTCDNGTVGDGYINLAGFNATATNLFAHGSAPSGVSYDRWLDVSNGGAGIAVSMYATGEGPFTTGSPVGTGTLTSMYWLYRSRIVS